MRAFIFLLFLLLAIPGVAQGEEVEDVSSRGERTRLLVEQPSRPWVTVVLFAGGHGVLGITDNGSMTSLAGNFLVRSRTDFQAAGAITAVIDAPTDRPNKLHGFRGTPEHAQDVGAVIKHLKAKYKLPVWLVGTSRGTNSTANAAIRLEENKPDGIVLTSSMLKDNRIGEQVLQYELEKIAQPVLIAHHVNDACKVTPPGKVEKLKTRLTNAKPVKVMMFDGGNAHGNPCHGNHYHGFKGIEETVVKDIMAWIKSQSR